MRYFSFSKLLLGVFVALAVMSCSNTKPEIKVSKINRDYHIDPEKSVGLIYGKINHGHRFGQKFIVSFKNVQNQQIEKMPIESFSGDGGMQNFFTEFAPGEWTIETITTEENENINIQSLKKDEHKEIIVETGIISYVGTWEIDKEQMSVVNEKDDQDQYMRKNYKYVLTSNALVTLP
ncbi:MAG: hypothetical protein HQK83_16980 [Fibrobacteria bacterium]|nr:hypothetical protein [Fibrobacteria bacterium]